MKIEINKPSTQGAPAEGENRNQQQRGNVRNMHENSSRPVRVNNSTGPVLSTPKNFKGATPQIRRILALRSENMLKKVNYDKFCKKLHTYIANNFKNGDAIVEVTRNPSATIIEDFIARDKPIELLDEEQQSNVKVEIKKEEIKEYTKGFSLIRSNLKKVHVLIVGNCTVGVLTMLRADS